MVVRVYRLHERLVNLRSEYNLRLKSGVTLTQVPMTQVVQAPMSQVTMPKTSCLVVFFCYVLKL